MAGVCARAILLDREDWRQEGERLIEGNQDIDTRSGRLRAGGALWVCAGWRRDQIDFDNQDLVQSRNSFHEWVGVNSPKATVSFLPGKLRWLPQLSASWGEAFFTEDPRIGVGNALQP